ncbi:MAG: HK97 family phage prohead protease [Sedimentisphaerales bacterium]|nr:HK97 family phage prohead protease [Sedimentisphaerales bacterium]
MGKDAKIIDLVNGKQGRGDGSQEKFFTGIEVKSVDVEKRQITGLASTGALDRTGEIVLPSAFKKTLPEFMKNPVVLAAHLSELPGGHSPVVGKVVKAWIDSKGLNITVEFAKTELGEEYWILYSQKTQRAFSIGFRVLQSHDDYIEGKRVEIITEVELYEISCVAIPANQEALVKSKQAKADFVAGKKNDRIAAAIKKEIADIDTDNRAKAFTEAFLGVDDSEKGFTEAGESIFDKFFA